jgi:8-oxo-dGTP pyrophosphatase MutT (NUDIX family)
MLDIHRSPQLVTTFFDHQNRPVIRPPDAPIIWRPSVYAFIVHTVDDEEWRLALMKNRGRSQWEVPGGGQEPGETIQRAIAREVEEEIGLQVAFDGEPFGLNERFYTIKTEGGVRYCHGHVCAMEIFVEEVPPQCADVAEVLAKGLHPETAESKWIDLRRLRRDAVFPACHALFKAFFERYPKHRSLRGGWT